VLTAETTETFQWKVPQPKGGVAMASPFAPIVVSYSVEDFEK